MNSLRRAIVFSFLEKYALLGITLISFFIIARLLTPQEIGIYSVSAALIGMAQVIREFGVGNYLIQKKDLTEQHIGTALGFSFVLGFSMFLVYQLGAPLTGRFYADHRLTNVVRIISINFLLLPFCSISISLLRRDMRFGQMMVVNTIATIVGTGTTLILAWGKWGPQSLAWGAVACNITTGVGAWLARDNRKLIIPSLRKWREIVSFGGLSTVAAVVTSVAMDINDLVVGKVMGLAPVAMLNRAQGLMNLMHRDLMGAVLNVAFPVFSGLHRKDENIEPSFIAAVTSVTAFAWPFYGFIALYPLEILRIMFGSQWDASSSLVPPFAAAGALSALYTLIPSVMLAAGRVDLVTKSELLFQPLRAGIIVLFAITFKSLLACAIAFLISFALALPIFYIFKNKCVPNDFRGLFKGLRQSLMLSVLTLAAAGIYSFSAGISRAHPISLVEFGLVCGFTAICWLSFAIWLKHPISADPLFRRIFSRVLFFQK